MRQDENLAEAFFHNEKHKCDETLSEKHSHQDQISFF